MHKERVFRRSFLASYLVPMLSASPVLNPDSMSGRVLALSLRHRWSFGGQRFLISTENTCTSHCRLRELHGAWMEVGAWSICLFTNNCQNNQHVWRSGEQRPGPLTWSVLRMTLWPWQLLSTRGTRQALCPGKHSEGISSWCRDFCLVCVENSAL